MAKKTTLKIVLGNIMGFIVFLALLWLANYARVFISNSFYNDVVQFLIDNLGLSFIIFFFSLFSAAFWNLGFPANLPSPVFSAFFSLFVIKYLYNLWLFIENYIKVAIEFPIKTLYYLVFSIVLIVGYIIIISRAEKITREKEVEKPVKEKEAGESKEEKKVEWHHVGDEFKKTLYNVGRGINNLFAGKKEKTKKKKKKRI